MTKRISAETKLFLLAFALAAPVWGQDHNALPLVVSSASFNPRVAPASWATVFGAGLARLTEVATTLDADGQLPPELAGTSVSVNGEMACLSYVSPTQVNFLVPEITPAGTASVIVTSASTGQIEAPRFRFSPLLRACSMSTACVRIAGLS